MEPRREASSEGQVKLTSVPTELFESPVRSELLGDVLCTIQQNQVQFTAMADAKASIMITVCSIVLTVGITRFQDPILRWPLVGLTACTLLALLFAILAVIPSLRYPRDAAGAADVLAPGFNLLFFGHFSHLPCERFETLLDAMARDDGAIYRAVARDLYGQGVVLAHKKYRMLRYSYAVFLIGIALTAVAAIEVLFSSPT